MDDDAWNKRKSKVMTYLDSNDIGEMKPVIEWNIATGDADAENRKRYWTSITTLFGMLDNSPITRGRETTLPTAVNQGILDYCVGVREASINYFNSGDMANCLEKHGKSGGGLYDSADEYADSVEKSVKGRLTRYYRNNEKEVEDSHTWDGTFDKNGSPTVNYYIAPTEEVQEE